MKSNTLAHQHAYVYIYSEGMVKGEGPGGSRD